MSMRISSALAAALALAGCGAQSPPPPGREIECAIGAGAKFARVCTIEVIAEGTGIVLHHPDGGFRRLIRNPVNGSLGPRDGAEPLVFESGEGEILRFAIGTDRYRFSPTMLDPLAP